MKWLDALHRMMERRRVKVVAKELLRYHAIDLNAAPEMLDRTSCAGPECRPTVPEETVRLSKHMHQQSHVLHVLQWQAERFAASVQGEVVEAPAVPQMHSARPL